MSYHVKYITIDNLTFVVFAQGDRDEKIDVADIIKHGILCTSIFARSIKVEDYITNCLMDVQARQAYDAAGFPIAGTSGYRQSGVLPLVGLISQLQPSDFIEWLKQKVTEKWDENLCSTYLQYYSFHDVRKLLLENGYPNQINSWSDLNEIKNKHEYVKLHHVGHDNIRTLFYQIPDILNSQELKDAYDIKLLPINKDKLQSLLFGDIIALNQPIPKFTCKYNGIMYACDYIEPKVIMYPIVQSLDSYSVRALKASSGNNNIIIESDLDNIAKWMTNLSVKYIKNTFVRDAATTNTSLEAVSVINCVPASGNVMNVVNLRNEDIKSLNRRLGAKVTGDKAFLIDEFKKGIYELYSKVHDKIKTSLPSFGIVSNRDVSSAKVSVDKNSELFDLEMFCLAVYLVKHSHSNALFINDKENDLFDINMIIDGLVGKTIDFYRILLPLEDKL